MKKTLTAAVMAVSLLPAHFAWAQEDIVDSETSYEESAAEMSYDASLDDYDLRPLPSSETEADIPEEDEDWEYLSNETGNAPYQETEQ